MTTYIALLRGINVGGHHKLPMADLRELLAGIGLSQPRTYIQSGNAAFEGEEADPAVHARNIRVAINERFGFEPAVLVLPLGALQKAAAANPYPQAAAEPKTLHLYFLAEEPSQPDLEGLAALRDNGEQFTLQDDVLYLYAPAGIGRSKLAERVERLLGVQATARNWRTVGKLLELAQS